jgi:FkbM family methyltransferase
VSFQPDIISQLNQDLFVLRKLNHKREGYFVEVGACHPIKLSNTYRLEHDFNWKGLLVEPNPELVTELRKFRTAAVIPCAVSNSLNSVNLIIATNPEFSKIANKKIKNSHGLFESTGKSVTVDAWKLEDLFEQNKVPSDFDVLTIDIEGNELEALKSNDWLRWKPKLVLVEHNFRHDRQEMRNYLFRVGYRLASENSRSSWDDWFELMA